MSIYIDLKDDRSEKVKYDGKYPIYIRHGLLSSYPHFSAPSHWHDDLEFILLISGKMDYNINGEIIHLKKNDGLFVNARQMHFGFSTDNNECDFICILIHPSLLCCSPDMEKDYIAPIVKNQSFAYELLTDKIGWHRELCHYLKMIYESKNKINCVLRVQGFFALIVSLLYENAPNYSAAETVQDRDLAIFKNMIGFIQQHYTEKTTLSKIAKSGCIGESKCCRLFQKYLNTTPISYLTEYRLNKSTEYLCTTDMTVTEIALSVGFGGGSYYTETFRKWLQMTPIEYRTNTACIITNY